MSEKLHTDTLSRDELVGLVVWQAKMNMTLNNSIHDLSDRLKERSRLLEETDKEKRALESHMHIRSVSMYDAFKTFDAYFKSVELPEEHNVKIALDDVDTEGNAKWSAWIKSLEGGMVFGATGLPTILDAMAALAEEMNRMGWTPE